MCGLLFTYINIIMEKWSEDNRGGWDKKQLGGYMLDTNVFDYLLENQDIIEKFFKNKKFYITSIQMSEVENITNSDRRKSIQGIMKKIKIKVVSREFSVWRDDLHWSDDDIWGGELSDDFIRIENGNPNNQKDAMIFEACKRHKLALITFDKEFLKKAKAKIPTIKLSEIAEDSNP